MTRVHVTVKLVNMPFNKKHIFLLKFVSAEGICCKKYSKEFPIKHFK